MSFIKTPQHASIPSSIVHLDIISKRIQRCDILIIIPCHYFKILDCFIIHFLNILLWFTISVQILSIFYLSMNYCQSQNLVNHSQILFLKSVNFLNLKTIAANQLKSSVPLRAIIHRFCFYYFCFLFITIYINVNVLNVAIAKQICLKFLKTGVNRHLSFFVMLFRKFGAFVIFLYCLIQITPSLILYILM